MRTMHITIPAPQKRPKVLPMSLSEMLCTGTQSSGGQAERIDDDGQYKFLLAWRLYVRSYSRRHDGAFQ